MEEKKKAMKVILSITVEIQYGLDIIKKVFHFLRCINNIVL